MKQPVKFLSGKPKSLNPKPLRPKSIKKSAARSSHVRKRQRITSAAADVQTMPKRAFSQSNALKYLQLGASISLIALIFLCLAWETVLAPLKPQGSWLMLKAAFLCLPLLGILKGRRYTYQWACMFILFYFIEGCVRAWADVGISAKLALIEVLLTTLFFFCTIYYAKYSAKLSSKPANS